MINIKISDSYTDHIKESILKEAVEKTLQHLNYDFSNKDLSIVIEDSEALHRLNLQYRQIDAPTDVLSFSANDIDPETGHEYLGDVIISYPEAEKQAGENNQPVESELQLLAVHGTLHLLGYDHIDPHEKDTMWKIQIDIMNSLGHVDYYTK